MSRKQKDFSVTYPILSLRRLYLTKQGSKPSFWNGCARGMRAGLPRAWEPPAAPNGFRHWLRVLCLVSVRVCLGQ